MISLIFIEINAEFRFFSGSEVRGNIWETSRTELCCISSIPCDYALYEITKE